MRRLGGSVSFSCARMASLTLSRALSLWQAATGRLREQVRGEAPRRVRVDPLAGLRSPHRRILLLCVPSTVQVLSFLCSWIVAARRPRFELTGGVPRNRYGLSWTGGKEGRGSEILTVVCSTLVVYPRHSV